MINDQEHFEALCAAYALGALDTEEQYLLDDALTNGGEEFQKIFRESVGISYLINTSVKRITPSPMVKSKFLKRIRKSQRTPFSLSLIIEHSALTLGFGSPRFGLIVSFLMVIVAIEIGAYALLLHHDLSVTEQQLSIYESSVAEQQSRLTRLTTELQQTEEILKVLQSPTIEIVIMTGQEVNPSGYGKIIWDPVRNTAILHVSKLPAVPAGKEYQLWFLEKNKKPVSAGVFNVAMENENYFKVTEIQFPENKKDIGAFAITIEPKGGVSQPTGAMYLKGSPTFTN